MKTRKPRHCNAGPSTSPPSSMGACH